MPLHQIYATYCTYGTSAIERRAGEAAERGVGASARASSFLQEDLRRHYPTLSRILAYGLPSDSPADARLSLDARSAPCRLFFHPNVSGWQVGGQVAYRSRAAASQAASAFFAHVVCAERVNEPLPLSPLDILQLWRAPGWVQDEASDLGHDLPILHELDALRQFDATTGHAVPFRPAIRDDVFRALLTAAPSPGKSVSADSFIPERWRVMPTHQRVELFRRALRGYLEILGRQRDSALLVIEPSVAVCFFYGIARLLPPGPLRDAISFSTYEPHPDRLVTTLAATCFHDSLRTDLKPDRYQRGFVLNTFLGGKSSEVPQAHPYADFIVDTLLEGGWPAVQSVHDGFQVAQGQSIHDLGELVKAHEISQNLINPLAKMNVPDWEKSDFTRRFVGKSIATALAGPPNEPRLQALMQATDGRASTIIRLLSGSQHAAACDASLRKLTEMLPEEQFLAFVEMAGVPAERKVQTLATFVAQHKRLPNGCEIIFEAARSTPRTLQEQQLRPLAIRLLQALSVDAVRELVDGVHRDHQAALFICLAEAVGPQEEKQKCLRRLALDMKEESLSDAVEQLGERTDLLAPEVRRVVGLRFVQILNAIHHSPAEFATRLTWVKRASRLIEQLETLPQKPGDLGPSWAPIDRLNAWCLVPEAIRNAKSSGSEKRAGWNPVRGEGRGDLQYRVGKQLAEALSRTLPHDEMRSQMSPQDKAVLMHHIIVALGGADLVSVDWKNRAAYYLEYGHWYDTAAPVARGAAAQQKKKWIFFGVGAGLITAIGTLALLLSGGGEQVAQNPQSKDGGGNKPTSSGKPAATAKPGAEAKTKPKAIPTDNRKVSGERTGDSSSPAPSTPPAESDLDSLPDAPKPKPNSPAPHTGTPASPTSEEPEKKPAKPADSTVPPSPSATSPMDSMPPMKESEQGSDLVERDYEVAKLPEPPQSELPLRIVPKPPATNGGTATEVSYKWDLWRSAGAKYDEDSLTIHGLSAATDPWKAKMNDFSAAFIAVNDVKIAGRLVVRATPVDDSDGNYEDLAEFRCPKNTGTITLEMKLKQATSPELFEIQKQIFFCVLEIRDLDGKPTFIALQPAITDKKISMLKDDVRGGNIRAKTENENVVPRPASSSLQKLFLVRGVLYLRDGSKFKFGEKKWFEAPPFSEWPLVAPEESNSLEGFRVVLADFNKVTTLKVDAPLVKDAAIDKAVTTLEKEIKDIVDARSQLNRGRRAKEQNEAVKHVTEAASKLASILGEAVRKAPEYQAPKGNKKDELDQAQNNFETALEEYKKWLDGLVTFVDKKQKELQAQLIEQKKKQEEVRSQGSRVADEFRSNLESAQIELFREVWMKDGSRKIRVPVMLFPSKKT